MAKRKINAILKEFKNDRSRLMDILWAVQNELGCISQETVEILANGLNISAIEVDEVVSFYHFFHEKPLGRYVIYLNTSVTALMSGYSAVKNAFEAYCGCKFGETDPSGTFTLLKTPCMGMSDQEVAALINFVPFTNLTPYKVAFIVEKLKSGWKLEDLIEETGDGMNAKIGSMVNNHLYEEGKIFSPDVAKGTNLETLLDHSPSSIINEILAAGLLGRGGAGFGAGVKWRACRKAASNGKTPFIICNADEGEPGTFKDRVLLTEFPHLLIEGMVTAAYALGAKEGFIYLRAEYYYLQQYLEDVMEDCRKRNLLGKDILGQKGFDFDIRIQMGAGAYVCGEESALIESMEGKRGSPRLKPPFPVQVGYKGQPTVVNNVETLCAVPRIIQKGAKWYSQFGTDESTGTKLLSVSGDCGRPGVHELPFGITVKEFLDIVGAPDAYAIQVSGPSGQCIKVETSLNRRLCYEDLSVGGSMIVFGIRRRTVLIYYMSCFIQFFMDESCGVCTPCRAGNVILFNTIVKLLKGQGSREDLQTIKDLARVMACTTRCGLGQMSPNPLVSTIREFPELYEVLIKNDYEPDHSLEFNLENAMADYLEITQKGKGGV